MPQRDLGKSLSLPMLVALGTAGVLGTSWIYTASEFFADYGAGGEIFGLGVASLLAVCAALAYAELSPLVFHALAVNSFTPMWHSDTASRSLPGGY